MTAVSKKKLADFSVKTIEQVGRFLKISARQVSSYIARGMPGRSGCYPLDEITQWVRGNVWDRPRTNQTRSGGVSRSPEVCNSLETTWRALRSKRTSSMQLLADLAGIEPSEVEHWKETEEDFPISPDGTVSQMGFILWCQAKGKVED